MRSRFSRLFIFGLVLVFALVAAGCGGEQKSSTIKIGVIAPLTGNQASIGKAVVEGIQSAAKRPDQGANPLPIGYLFVMRSERHDVFNRTNKEP